MLRSALHSKTRCKAHSVSVLIVRVTIFHARLWQSLQVVLTFQRLLQEQGQLGNA